MLNATRSVFTGMFRRFGLGTIAGVVLVLGLGVAAFAYWTTVGTGAGSASASGLNPPTNVSLAVNDSAVTVSFTGVTPTNGTLTGYYVQRNNGSVTSNACGTNPTTPGTFLASSATSCADTSVPNATYTYTVTSVLNTWTAKSEPSASLVVTGDTHAPSQVVSMTSSNALKTGNTIYFRAAVAGSLTLSSAVTDGISGPASATFPAISTTGWTHASETVTTGSGTNPKTFASSTFTWNAGAATPSTYGVVGQDVVGNQTTTDLTFVADNDGPTGGALTVNGTTGTTAGAVNVITSGANFTGSKTNFSADAGSGYLSTTLTREASTSNTCTAWNSASTISSISEDGSGGGMTVSNDRCYRYTLTGTDKMGNISSLSVIVAFVDATDPTPVLTMGSATNAVLSQSSSTAATIYYRKDLSGSFTLVNTLTDYASGPKSSLFPAISTTGWTHNVETVTSGTGARPTIAYTSTSWSWTGSGSLTNPSSKNVTSSDQANNTINTALTFTSDTTAPTGGSITVNGTASTNGGTTAYAPNTFTGSVVNFTDAGVGIATNVITRATATLTGSTCGTFGTAAVVASISESGATGCIKYVLTGTDLLANATTSTITVKVDGSAPTVAVSGETGANSYSDGSNIYYRSGSSGSFTLTATVGDAFPGAKSATFPAIATTGWTHGAETVTTAASTSGTVTTYTSSSFTWTASPSVPASYTVTGADQAGNTATSTVAFVADAAGPTAGALAVNSVNGTSVGSTSYSKTGTFSGTFTQFSADAGSGFASSAITKESATLTNGTCGSYSAGTAPTGGSISETTVAEGCYRYTVTGTDNVGNTSVLATVVMVDKTAPTQVVSATGSNAYVDNANSKIYYNGSGSSRSFTLTSAVTEAGSGGVTVTFPSLAGTSTGFSFTNSADSSSPFTSNSVTWSSGTTSTPTITVNATDAAGNSNDKLLTFVNDITVPTAGALSVAGQTTAPSNGNSSSSSSWAIAVTNYTDAGSGIEPGILTVASARYSNSACGSYGSTTNITGTSPYTNQSNGNCYRFIWTGTDKVGNVATKTVIMRYNNNDD